MDNETSIAAESGTGSGNLGGSAVLRDDWLQSVVSSCQVFAITMCEIPLAQLNDEVRAFVAKIPDPTNDAEWFVQRGLLLQLALGLGTTLHLRVHGDKPHRCGFDPAAAAHAIWRDRQGSPARMLLDWTERIARSLGDYDLELFATLRECVDKYYHEPLPLRVLSKRIGRPVRELEQACRRHTDLSASSYIRSVRLEKATTLLVSTDLKIEAIAWTVGFRSTKNIYEGLKQWLGVTPSQIRNRGFSSAATDAANVPPAFRKAVTLRLSIRSAPDQ